MYRHTDLYTAGSLFSRNQGGIMRQDVSDYKGLRRHMGVACLCSHMNTCLTLRERPAASSLHDMYVLMQQTFHVMTSWALYCYLFSPHLLTKNKKSLEAPIFYDIPPNWWKNFNNLYGELQCNVINLVLNTGWCTVKNNFLDALFCLTEIF